MRPRRGGCCRPVAPVVCMKGRERNTGWKRAAGSCPISCLAKAQAQETNSQLHGVRSLTTRISWVSRATAWTCPTCSWWRSSWWVWNAQGVGHIRRGMHAGAGKDLRAHACSVLVEELSPCPRSQPWPVTYLVKPHHMHMQMTSLEQVLYGSQRRPKAPRDQRAHMDEAPGKLSLQHVLLLACDVAAGLAHLHPCTVWRWGGPGPLRHAY